MDALYLAGHFANDAAPARQARSLDSYYEEYRPNPLRHLVPLASAFGTVGAWVALLTMIPR
jgi:hypothetical protein